MRTNQPSSSQAAAAAREAARQAALERAREAARQAAMERAREAAQQRQAEAAQARMAAEATTVDAGAAHAMAGGPTGEVALAAAPAAIASDADLLAALGVSEDLMQEPAAMAFMRETRQAVEGLPREAVAAIARLLHDPSAFYAQGQSLVGTPYQAQALPDAEAIAGAATGPTLAEQLRTNPDLKDYPEETLNQLASFRQAPSAEVQEALDRAALETLSDSFDPEDLNPAMAHIIATSEDSGVKEKLEEALSDWAKEKLEDSLDGKEKEEGAQEGLEEFQEAVVELAEKTGLGEVLEKVAEKTLKDGEDLIEETSKRGQGILDRVTGAVSGFIEGAYGAIGDGIKAAVGAVGDVAEFTLDKTGDVWEKGLDLAAAGFDAVGLEGAGDVARATGDAVDGAYDWVGRQESGFIHGVGDALGDTVTGIGSTMAHPIETVKGVAHLVTHPKDIALVGKALWAEASKGGVSHALGYVAGNLAPALLSGGSSSGAGVLGRLGAIAGESRALTTLVQGARASRVGQLASRAATAVSRSRVVQAVGRGRALLGESRVAQAIGRGRARIGDLRNAAGRAVRESRLGRLTLKAGEELKLTGLRDRFKGWKRNLNDRVDGFLGRQVRKLDDLAERVAPGSFTPRAASVESRIAQLEALGVKATPIDLGTEDVQGVIARRGADGDAIYREVAQGESQALARNRELGELRSVRGPDDIQGLRRGDRLQGTAHRGGVQPDIVADLAGPRFEARIGRDVDAVAANPNLTPQQKLEEINRIVNRELRPNYTPELDEALTARHQEFIEAGRPISTEDYLRAGEGAAPNLADCRGYAAVHQMALQRAGFESGIAVSNVVLQDAATALPPGFVSEARGLSHYYNVVELDGQLVIADAFNPAAAGHELAEALTRGFVDRDGGRYLRYTPGTYGATVLNDGAALSGLALTAPALAPIQAADR